MSETTSKREERKAQIHQRIIESCLVLMGQKHFQEITIKDICEEANIARRTLYSYFNGKDELLDEVSQTVMYEGTINSFTDALANHQSTKARLNEAFSKVGEPMNDFQGENIKIFIQLIQNLTLRISVNTAMLTSFHEAVFTFYTECFKNEDTLDGLDTQVIADLTVNALVGIIMSWVNNQDYPAQQRIMDLKNHVAKMILR